MDLLHKVSIFLLRLHVHLCTRSGVDKIFTGTANTMASQLCVPEMPKNIRLQWRTHNKAGPTENREGDGVDAEQVSHGVVLMRWFILARRKRGCCVLLVHLKRRLSLNGTQMNSFCDAHTTSSPRSSIATEQEQ